MRKSHEIQPIFHTEIEPEFYASLVNDVYRNAVPVTTKGGNGPLPDVYAIPGDGIVLINTGRCYFVAFAGNDMPDVVEAFENHYIEELISCAWAIDGNDVPAEIRHEMVA